MCYCHISGNCFKYQDVCAKIMQNKQLFGCAGTFETDLVNTLALIGCVVCLNRMPRQLLKRLRNKPELQTCC